MGLTIKDIAERAGVSTATISRVLNNSKPVSPEIRRRVIKIIEETGYQPNALARGLVKRRTGLIGVMVPEIGEVEYAELLRGIEGEARVNGFSIIPASSQGLLEKELEILDDFRGRQLEGIIFSGSRLTRKHRDYFKDYKMPVVTVGQNFSHLNLPSVTINNFQAAYVATEHLISLGHTRIALISGLLKDNASGLDRYRGFNTALKESGLEEKKEFIREGVIDLESGYQKMREILKYTPPTGVFAASDKLAVGALNCCLESGYRVPDDISIIGFGDLEIASAVRPALTTIHKDNREMGATTARLLFKRIRKQEGGIWNLMLPCRLIVRESTAGCNNT